MAVTTAVVVLFRYFLDGGSIALQESIIYLHATIFLLGASAGLKYGAHVRVDIFFRQMSSRKQAWVDTIGTITLLLPITVFIVAICWPYVVASWAIYETSADAGGLAFVWLLKTLMLLGGALLGLQAIAELFRSIALLLQLPREPE